MMRNKPILCWIVMAGAALPIMAATPGHYPISTGDVAATISASGLTVAPEQISFACLFSLLFKPAAEMNSKPPPSAPGIH
jgi:hypothetical protein